MIGTRDVFSVLASAAACARTPPCSAARGSKFGKDKEEAGRVQYGGWRVGDVVGYTAPGGGGGAKKKQIGMVVVDDGGKDVKVSFTTPAAAAAGEPPPHPVDIPRQQLTLIRARGGPGTTLRTPPPATAHARAHAAAALVSMPMASNFGPVIAGILTNENFDPVADGELPADFTDTKINMYKTGMMLSRTTGGGDGAQIPFLSRHWDDLIAIIVPSLIAPNGIPTNDGRMGILFVFAEEGEVHRHLNATHRGRCRGRGDSAHHGREEF